MNALAYFDSWLENNPAVRLLGILGAVLGFGVVMATACQIYIDIDDRRIERVALLEDRFGQAMETILRKTAGNTGKGAAISFVHKIRRSIDGLDTSCKAMGLILAHDQCSPTIRVTDLLLDGVNNDTAIKDLNLSGNLIISPVFRKVSFYDLKLDQALIENGVFDKVTLKGWQSSDKTWCRDCIFFNSSIHDYGYLFRGGPIVYGGTIEVSDEDAMEKLNTVNNPLLERPLRSYNRRPRIIINQPVKIHTSVITKLSDQELQNVFQFCAVLDGAGKFPKNLTIKDLAGVLSTKKNQLSLECQDLQFAWDDVSWRKLLKPIIGQFHDVTPK